MIFKYHNKDKREAFISNLREAYHPLGLKWKTYTEINSLFNARLKSYFFKGLEFAMLLRDSNDIYFIAEPGCTFIMMYGQVLDQSSGFSHNFNVSKARKLFFLIMVPQLCFKYSYRCRCIHTYFVRS